VITVAVASSARRRRRRKDMGVRGRETMGVLRG
jgi:hypothetical protein